ncbi:transporter substrate-binding domain-containing protein [Desulfobacterales bacterium HSG2]|nr:transporter substrate-binding domain-containing protein [Desulfobacterales bacterium HSG2]
MKQFCCRLSMITFIIMLSFYFTAEASAGLFFTDADVTQFEYNEKRGSIDAQAVACPRMFILPKWVGGDTTTRLAKQALEKRIEEFEEDHPDLIVRQPAPITTQLKTSMFRSAEKQNRCTVANVLYTVHHAESGAAAGAVTGGKPPLKFGVRPGYPMISQLDGSEWHGAAIIFAKKIARKLERKPVFVKLNDARSRFVALDNEMADVVISLITYTSERKKMASLSDPYFETGLIAGSLNTETAEEIRSQKQINRPEITMLVGKGTTAESYAKKHFGKAKLRGVSTTAKAYQEARKLEEQGKGRNLVFLTDEIIAAVWEGAFFLKLDGKTLLTTDDEYVVAVRKGDPDKLLKAINKVIKKEDISRKYENIAGR